MWMSDRPRTQQRLAVDLANLVEVLPAANVFPFLQAFWKTMAREWNGIDVLRYVLSPSSTYIYKFLKHLELTTNSTNLWPNQRMNKFLLLVRRYLFASFTYLRKQNWEVELVKQHNALLESIPLHPGDIKIPNGMRYHVIDIYVDEIDQVDQQRSSELPLDLLLEPLRQMQERSPTKAVRDRAKEALDHERLKGWSSSEAMATEQASLGDRVEEEEEGDVAWEGFDD